MFTHIRRPLRALTASTLLALRGTRRRWAHATVGAACVVVAATAIAGCGGDDDTTALPNGVEADAVPESQRAAFADGEVTFEEYSAAVDQLVTCVRDQGFTISDPIRDPARPQYFYYETSAMAGAEDAATDRAVAECEQEHLTLVALAWADANFDPDSPLSDDTLYVDTVACLERTTGDDLSGIDPSNSADLDQLIARYDALYDDCLHEAADALLAEESG